MTDLENIAETVRNMRAQGAYQKKRNPKTFGSEAKSAPALLTVHEAAASLGVCDQTIFNLMKRGQLEGVKIGRARRVKTSSVLALINGAE